MTRQAPSPPTSSPGTIRLAAGAVGAGPPILREVFSLSLRPGVTSFAIGLPATEMFPVEDLARLASDLLVRRPEVLQYGMPSQALKAQIVELMAWRGVACSTEQIFLTSGAQQGMDLLCHLLLDPRGQVMIERTVFECTQGTIRKFMPEVLALPTDLETGLDVEAVAARLAAGARPAFLYTIPTGHNPLGVSLSLERRRRLAAIARQHELPILEDDAYGFVGYDGDTAPALRSLEDRWVLYLGSFSKILAPALRVGWLVVPEELIPRLQALKQGSDIDTSTFSQALVAAYLEAGLLPARLERLRATYRERRDAAWRALGAHFPAEARWNRPTAGMFLWVELPERIDATALLRTAVETERVAFSPGAAFAAGGGHHADSCLRLSFANLPPEEIDDGIARLARVVRRALAKP